MSTPIDNRDLQHEAPHSPNDRIGGFAILARTVDKCRATLNGQGGDYHFDCPLDNQLFSFKGINGNQFKPVAGTSKTYEDVATWLKNNGTPKTDAEIKAWSDKVCSTKMKDVPTFQDAAKRKEMTEELRKLGLDFEKATLFEWLDADDRASFKEPVLAGR